MGASGIPPQFLAHARRACPALPHATERESWGHPTFRVRDKEFAALGIEESMASVRCSMTMKAPPGEQESTSTALSLTVRPSLASA